jgi:inner membrane protein
VVQEISNLQGGAQQILGPLMIVPYTVPAQAEGGSETTGWYVISPEEGSVDANLDATVRYRGLFQVPTFHANQVQVTARFGAPPAVLNLPTGATVDWAQAQIVMGFSDLRGAQRDVVGRVTPTGGPAANVTFAPEGLNLGEPRTRGPARGEGRSGFGLLSTPAAALLAGRQGGTFTTTLELTGAQRLAVLPFARSTRVRMHGDWASPSFDGGFLPATRTVTAQGFDARWNVPFLARGLTDHGPQGELNLAAFGDRDVGVTLMRQNDPYQSVTRALKYAVMFVGLVFLTFFVFEAMSGRRLHPAQYVLIGMAQMVFYLLLLSLSEWVGFDIAFGAAAVATVGLIGLYAGWAFRSTRYQIQALAIFTAVYGLIYLLMRLEDFALLAGSLASFLGLSVAMWLTRNLDWYAGRVDETRPAATPAAPVA